jgi:outer membrane biosynthesis protein TonB
LARTLTLYVSPNASQTAKDFAEFLTPEHCAGVLAKHRLLPPAGAVKPDAKEDLVKEFARHAPKPGEAGKEPLALLLDDPDAPAEKPVTPTPKKTRTKPVEKPSVNDEEEPVAPAADEKTPQPKSEPKSDAARAPVERTAEQPAVSREEWSWIVGGGGGLLLLAVTIGWLSAGKRKKKPRR